MAVISAAILMVVLCFTSSVWADPATPDTAAVKPEQSRPYLVVEGTIVDDKTGEPVGDATVQAIGQKTGAVANKDGRFRLVLPQGQYTIKATHVGHYAKEATVAPATAEGGSSRHQTITQDFRLMPLVIDMGVRQVFIRAYDPAQRIIAQAIAHKKDILSRVHDYSFNAYAKLVVRNGTKPDSQSIMLITETHVTSFWEQPDKYKEIITARKQSANLPAEGNLVSVGGLLNFNRNRLDLGEYSVVSPTATDAMDHYNYYLLDTVYLDNRAVFVLEVEPKNEYEPLFKGNIQIVDSTYDVVMVDMGLSKGIRVPMASDFRYFQHMAPIGNESWLPVQVGFSFRVNLDVPGLPKIITVDHSVAISDYKIDAGLPAGMFDEYQLEVDRNADKVDSSVWSTRVSLPLTGLEQYGYTRIDSLEHAPKPLGKKLLAGAVMGALLMTVGYPDVYHYSRVEGHYLGLGTAENKYDGLRLRGKIGYGFSDHHWQGEAGGNFRLLEKQKLWVGGMVKDEIMHRPTTISANNYNPTFNAFMLKIDPFDYYRERGFELNASVKPVDYTRLTVSYGDFKQTSVSSAVGHSVFRRSVRHRGNPPILDGDLHSLSAAFRYDSRKLINNKGVELPTDPTDYFLWEIGAEYSSPDFAGSDFDFRWYYLKAQWRSKASGLGITTLTGYAGTSDGHLPPQKYFSVDFHDPDFFRTHGFNTVLEGNFGGDRMASLYLSHDFGHFMFRSSGIEFLKKIPAGLVIHGGAFWTRFRNDPLYPGNEYLRTAPTAYTEIGFGLNNLTPFLSPFNLSIHFTWQLSPYDTERYSQLTDFTF
ncbi:MAG: DUF5686 family protein [candidate division Zixibacteria bacterium]|nr:DUF5686 family protein [candidate division Zixibacteria bacterium]